jgi:uncharacterized iron-regulated membrane protein
VDPNVVFYCKLIAIDMRKIFFWLHLGLGIASGVVILIMSVTGVLLTYEKQMVAWMDLRNLPPVASGAAMPVESLLATVRAGEGKLPSAMLFYSDASKPVQVTIGRDTRYVDPVNGKVLGGTHAGIRAFFRVATEWHRYLGAAGPDRPTGKAFTGASNLAFLFIVLSGLYLWLPKVWSAASVRAISWFRGGLSGKARDFNWHNVIGVWCFVPLVFVVLGATVISYPWASNLVYQLTGSPVPGSVAPPPAGHASGEVDLAGLNQLWQRASTQVPEWRTMTLRVPAESDAPVAFVIDGGYAGQPQKRTTLTLDRSGAVQTAETFDELTLGRRVRTWLRFVHTGEYYGLPGQTIAGVASLGAVVLVYTGVALALRRLLAWRARNARQQQMAAKV